MYAIIETSGKQYRVESGIKIKVEKIAGSLGEEVKFNKVLLVNNEGEVLTGQPLVPGVLVIGEIVRQDRSKKIIVYKRRPKKGYRKTIGHRQYFTEVKIKEIIAKAPK
ncbi:MAG TPA: 50S ribosomal protein L21 [Elusimicrobia bacterium]|jgi:large subunit ribosomal protein L21|nr:50S ribosomal protein L21 [Elusimicrobiota bacterium]